MAKKSKIAKWLKPPAFPVRAMNRCSRCGRSRGYIRFASLCRICFRQLALQGQLPGIQKASW